ncbi:MAG: glycoside hydrolase family 19 protein, partial [Polymorphobacter sp.]
MLNEAQIRELYPRADGAHVAAFAARNGDLFARFGISDNRLRLEFLLAQIGHESGGLTALVENLDYRAGGIARTWPKIFASEVEAAPFAHNPEKLANRVYAAKYGNGPTESGDGYRFRGRGYIQLTFRDGYQQVGDIAGMDFAGHPDSVLRPENAL